MSSDGEFFEGFVDFVVDIFAGFGEYVYQHWKIALVLIIGGIYLASLFS